MLSGGVSAKTFMVFRGALLRRAAAVSGAGAVSGPVSVSASSSSSRLFHRHASPGFRSSFASGSRAGHRQHRLDKLRVRLASSSATNNVGAGRGLFGFNADLSAAFPALSRALQRFSVDPPKSFRKFFPESSTKTKTKSSKSKSTSTKNSKKKESARTGTAAGSKEGSGKSNSPFGGPEFDGMSNFPWKELGASAAILFFLYSMEREKMTPQEITWHEFHSEMLSKGRVDHLVVINKSRCEVHLREWSEEGFAADGSGSGVEGGTPSSSYAGRINSASSQQTQSRLKTCYFTIGSVESFEKKLEAAQREIGISTHDFVPVQYSTEYDWGKSVMSIVPTLVLLGAFAFLLTRMGPGGAGGRGGNIFSIGKANAKQFDGELKNIKFKDVAGCDEAKNEIMEFVEFLKSPKRFTDVGAKIPKGALLYGPPGTGKTLLAKAAAGEASVPFFTMSGSDFIEMFVGVGPSRVRDLFKQAREKAPCIIFLDEIDAVARKRGKGGFSGGNDERENTLNQLLVEMDGFNTTEGIVVIAGTNRLDILDQAILRPGRFDRQIKVDLPDIRGRKDIFHVHMKGLKLEGGEEEEDSIAKRLAALTPGFSGADIANLCNEAAIFAARAKKTFVDMPSFDKAVDRVIGGLEKTSVMSKEEKRTVAYHEAGHAVAGWFLEHADPLLKVTIIPRMSGALGFAQYLPKEMALHTEQQLNDRICMALGGRIAEEINFGKVTTGAQDDLDKVTKIAYSMVSMFGMNSNVGHVSFNVNAEENQFKKPYSETTAAKIDDEVKLLIESAYARTTELLTEKKEAVASVAEYLLENETITQHDVERLIGPRPFAAPQSYKEFVEASGEMVAAKANEASVDDVSSDKGNDEAETAMPGQAVPAM